MSGSVHYLRAFSLESSSTTDNTLTGSNSLSNVNNSTPRGDAYAINKHPTNWYWNKNSTTATDERISQQTHFSLQFGIPCEFFCVIQLTRILSDGTRIFVLLLSVLDKSYFEKVTRNWKHRIVIAVVSVFVVVNWIHLRHWSYAWNVCARCVNRTTTPYQHLWR